ncbi:hypothetical protein M011DRAFT_30553 [Sporormia fimetaria CBS 119925]|uniref:Uncharacterized protein n=1 Tax=Sporormia fimetaria CBS 119925 TaxID=1340428 RepID=A0A6A6VBS6_9PLEO|nr:hypothetical protein M011DRAFT_30553 [Sporormia fimetaria CBS 119925]
MANISMVVQDVHLTGRPPRPPSHEQRIRHYRRDVSASAIDTAARGSKRLRRILKREVARRQQLTKVSRHFGLRSSPISLLACAARGCEQGPSLPLPSRPSLPPTWRVFPALSTDAEAPTVAAGVPSMLSASPSSIVHTRQTPHTRHARHHRYKGLHYPAGPAREGRLAYGVSH